MRVSIPPPLIVALFYLAIIIKDKSYHQNPQTIVTSQSLENIYIQNLIPPCLSHKIITPMVTPIVTNMATKMATKKTAKTINSMVTRTINRKVTRTTSKMAAIITKMADKMATTTTTPAAMHHQQLPEETRTGPTMCHNKPVP